MGNIAAAEVIAHIGPRLKKMLPPFSVKQALFNRLEARNGSVTKFHGLHQGRFH